MAKPILDLSTLIERPTIRIDGATYQLRNPEELSILDSQWLSDAGKRIETIAGTKGDGEELDAAIAEVVKRAVVDLPPDVFAKLSGSQRMAIVEVFTGLLTRRKMRVAGAMARAIIEAERLALIGASTSRDFSASTAAIPPSGFATPRSPS